MVLNGEEGKAEEIFQVDKNDTPYSKKLKSNKFNFSQNLHKNSNMEKECGSKLCYLYTSFFWFRLKNKQKKKQTNKNIPEYGKFRESC